MYRKLHREREGDDGPIRVQDLFLLYGHHDVWDVVSGMFGYLSVWFFDGGFQVTDIRYDTYTGALLELDGGYGVNTISQILQTDEPHCLA